MLAHPHCFFLLFIAAVAPAQADPYRIATLPEPATRVTTGDLTGDGVEDFVLGDPSAARVTVRDGQSYETIATIQGPARSDFGAALQCADRDGDGVDDTLAVGAPSANGTGQVFIYADIDLRAPAATAVADGPVPFSQFGGSLSIGEDTDRDGYLDLTVGAPFEDRPGWFNAGAVYAVGGLSGQVRRLLRGTGSVAQFGWRVAGPRSDFDGNPSTHHVVFTAPGSSNGRGAWGKVDYSTGAPLFGGASGSSTERMGHALLVTPDETGDGVPEICTGSPLADSPNDAPRAGKVTLHDGRSGRMIREFFSRVADDQLGLRVRILSGPVERYLAASGTGGPNNRGSATWFDFDSAIERLRRIGAADNDALANDLAVGNWNGDDTEDLAVLTPGATKMDVISPEMLEFFADTTTIDTFAGGTQNLFVNAPASAGRPYVILGSMSGFCPGFPFGGTRIPVNLDPYTEVLANPLFTGQWGSLDPQGRQQISFTIPPRLLAGLEVTLHHTLVVFSTASNFVDPRSPVATVLGW